MAKEETSFGMMAGANIANTALGQLGSTFFGKIHDQRQLEQQKKLNKLQIAGNKEMSDYERMQQMKIWNDTNYGAQIKHAKDAGMSISALYGGSGAGGATTGGGGGAGVTGGVAPDGNSSTGMGLQMASQLALMQAQKENIEADTANKKAGTESTTTQTEGHKVATRVAQTTENETIDKIMAEASKAQAEAAIAGRNNEMDERTVEDKIKTIQLEAVNKALENIKGGKEIRIKEAEAILQEFEANNAKQGISTKAPWYLKMVADILKKIGLNPLTP